MIEIQPSLEEFLRLGAAHRVVSVYAKLSADDLTAVGLYQQLCGTRDGTFLLESAEQGVWSRWSFVGVNCPTALSARGAEVSWLGRQVDGLPSTGEPLEVLADSLELLGSTRQPGLPPFTSGLVGYLGYDMVRHVETLPDENPDDLQLPEMLLLLTSDLAVLDHHRGEVWLIANAINFDGSPERIELAYADACARVRAMAATICLPRPVLTQPVINDDSTHDLEITRQNSPAEFHAMVRSAQQRITAGDIFQVVPSQRFDVHTDADALSIYRQLRSTNPSPYLFLLRLADGDRSFAVVGSSPEALVTVSDGLATTHPIAGTRPRGKDAVSDAELERELLADEKERAEHLMLVDLGRNDLGRVCQPGSVQVTEFMNVHRYSTVMHLEATVQGQVRPEFSALDVTMACFPAGTLSGAPKVMAMRIIDQLESTRRGIYGGVVGYFDFAGNSDMAIAIRTAVLADGIAHVQAGAGIVADSVAENEEAETRNKAASMLNAIRRAESTQAAAARGAGQLTVLDSIIAGVLADLAVDQAQISLADLQAQARQARPALDPKPAFRHPGLSVIAEVKRASPSAGALAEIADPAELAARYQAGGAAAISVLTEQRRFNGSLADLRAVRQRVNIPVLRKDFVVTEYQVWQARAAGADLVLLIVAALDDAQLRRLYELITELGMTALVEVHDEAEAHRAIALGAEVIGVNNRNLKTLEVDPRQFGRIAPLLPADVIKVAESGITDGAGAASFAAQGANVVLVGQALVTNASPEQAVAEMIEMSATMEG